MKKIVCLGEIMMRLSPPNHQRFVQANNLDVHYAGGEANVAVSLAQLGLPAEYITRLPKNTLGDCAINSLLKYGVGVEHIIRGGDKLGTYFLEIGCMDRGSKVIYDRAHSSMAEIQPGMIDWKSVFEGASWFHWSGITAAISYSAAETCREALEVASELGLIISVDFNYRSKLWKYGKDPKSIMSELTRYCDVVVGGERDAKIYFDIDPKLDDSTSEAVESETAYISVCRQLMALYPNIKRFVSTRREVLSASHHKLYSIMYDGEKMYKSKCYNLAHIVDRVGGGDAFMAGLIHGFSQDEADDHYVLEFATAASALKHSIAGDYNLVSKQEVDALAKGTNIRVDR